MRVHGALFALLMSFVSGVATAQSVGPEVFLRSFPLSHPRRGHTMTATADHRVVIAGGMGKTDAVGEVEILDPSTGTIAVAGVLGTTRTDHTATLLADGSVIFIGGANSELPLDSTEILDPRTNRITAGPKLQRPRAGHSTTRLDDHRLLITGGRGEDTAEVLDLSKGESTVLSARLTGVRHSHSAVVLRSGDVLLVGGVGLDGASLDTAEIFKKDGQRFAATDTWMQSRRVRPDLVTLPDGKVQVVGGDSGRTIEMYDPKGRYFRANARLLPTADALGRLGLLAASTRVALLDSVGSTPDRDAAPFTPANAGERKALAEALDGMVRTKPRGFAAQASTSALAADGTPTSLVFAGQDFRGQYSAVEIVERYEVAIGLAPEDEGALLESVVLMRRSPATLGADRIEYGPGGRPSLVGTGWGANEVVRIVRQSAITNERRVFEARATGYGAFVFSGLPADHEVGAYVLSAIGQTSGHTAQTAYMSAPPLDPATAGRAPFRFRIPTVPLQGSSSGTAQTPGGPMTWSMTDVAGTQPQAGAMSPEAKSDFAFDGGSVSFNPGCFGLPTPLNSAVQMCPSGTAQLSGSMDVDGGFDAGAIPNPACCVCEEIPGASCGDVCSFSCGGRAPSFSASFTIKSNFKTDFAADFTLDGKILNVNGIRVVDFKRFDAGYPALVIGGVQVPGTSDSATFGIHLGLGLLAGVNLTAAEPMKFHTNLGFDLQNVELSVGASTSNGFTQNARGNGSATAGFKLQEIGSTTLTLSLGVGATGKIQLKDTCDPLVDASLRPVAAFIDGTFQASGAGTSCQRYNLSSDWGFRTDGTVNAGCGSVKIQPASFGADIFRSNIASVNTGLFRDTGTPSVSCPANLVLPTAPGTCNAVATYTPTASDSCSGLKAGFGPQLSRASGSTFGLGTTTVTATAKDNADTADFPAGPDPNAASCQFTVKIEDRERPTLAAIPSVMGKSSDPGKCGAVVTFALTAGDNCPGVTTNSAPLGSGALFPVGLTNVTANAVDPSGNTTPRSFQVEIVDREAPAITGISASPSSLWPPNKKLVPVTINYSDADNCAVQSCKLSVVSNEPVGSGDIQVLDAHRLLLAADRRGNGNGRAYTTTITCTDAAKNTTTRTVNVVVPHNK